MIDTEALALQAIACDGTDARRIQHFMKVYAFSRLLGKCAGLADEAQNILEAAALLHDIGIHEAERKHGSNSGKWQETEGPAVAEPMLAAAGASPAESAQVCWMIAHHHSYQSSEDLAFRILLEADFLVNAFEDKLPRAACETADVQLFRTDAGRRMLHSIYLG